MTSKYDGTQSKGYSVLLIVDMQIASPRFFAALYPTMLLSTVCSVANQIGLPCLLLRITVPSTAVGTPPETVRGLISICSI